MNPIILTHLKERLTRLGRREDGSSIIELAIMFPILLILFVGTAELGRLFYTYTTLAKATYVGARYLSTSRNVVNGSADEKTDEKTEGKKSGRLRCRQHFSHCLRQRDARRPWTDNCQRIHL